MYDEPGNVVGMALLLMAFGTFWLIVGLVLGMVI